MSDRTRYIITLEDAGADGVPLECRLRQALKMLLRSWGFRCIDIRSTSTTDRPEISRFSLEQKRKSTTYGNSTMP